MKAETPDKELNEAIEFYATLALKEQIVVDTDAGFVSEKGEPVFTDMNLLEAKMRDMMNTQSRQTLEKNKVDAQEVMQFFEMCLVATKILGEDYHPPELRVHNIKHKENDKQRERRRQMHLWNCVQECIMATQPDVLHISDDGTGFAVDCTHAHPLLTLYVNSIQRYETDQFTQGTGTMRTEEVQEYLNKKAAEVNADAPKRDIDPDSDENDDDPFGMFV